MQDAGTNEESPSTAPEAELPVGSSFGPEQVEVPVAESTFVLESGYALAALDVELDGQEPVDVLVIAAQPERIVAHAAFSRGLGVSSRRVGSFRIAPGCTQPTARIRQLSASLVEAHVELACEGGTRSDSWILTVEAQPRARERITLFPPNPASPMPVELSLRVEDRDGDGYDDLVAETRVSQLAVPLTWLDRPGGFARDTSEPEKTFREQADEAWSARRKDPQKAAGTASSVIEAFRALCGEAGAPRVGLSGGEGLRCEGSPGTARAVAVAAAASIRRGEVVRALELQRWWESVGGPASAEERALVDAAWGAANASRSATWKLVDTEQSVASLHFTNDQTLVVDCRTPRRIDLASGAKTKLGRTEIVPPTRDPEGRFAVRGVRATCAGFEAEVRPIGSKQSHRVAIERRKDGGPCSLTTGRPASLFEWAVLGWAPQGLLAASGDVLRVVPLNAFAKPAGQPIDLQPGSPLPAPIRGPRVTPDGSRYVIPHQQGVFVRDWRKGRAGVWLRPADWTAVPGELRSVALAPSGRQAAVQKGSEIRVLSW